MDRFVRRTAGFALVLLAFGATQVQAQVYFGEDTDGSFSTKASLTNAMAAENLFLSFLTNPGTETFDSYATGTTAPIPANFGAAGTATLYGTGSIVDGTTPNFGRYSISDPNYWSVTVGSTSSFYIDFSNPIAAFGFYGIDVGDFGGQMSLSFLSGGNTIPVAVPHTVGAGGNPDGAAFYFGYINTTNLFTRVTFNFEDDDPSDSETFAFDNMTIGSYEQVVPEPMSVVLLGTGLLGVGIVARRRRRVEEE